LCDARHLIVMHTPFRLSPPKGGSDRHHQTVNTYVQAFDVVVRPHEGGTWDASPSGSVALPEVESIGVANFSLKSLSYACGGAAQWPCYYYCDNIPCVGTVVPQGFFSREPVAGYVEVRDGGAQSP
jgi:hypothetical protein